MTPSIPMSFYVYAHYTPDKPEPFYIGKGRGKRALSISGRTKWWKRTVEKHCLSGTPEVKFLVKGLTEEDAFAIERFWIAVFGRKGIRADGCLVNLTDGGDGASGLKHSEESKLRLSEALKGKKMPKRSAEHRRKLAEALRGENNPMFGKTLSAASRQKLSEAKRGKKRAKFSPETIRRMSESHKGKKFSPEHCRNISEAKKGRKRGTPPVNTLAE